MARPTTASRITKLRYSSGTDATTGPTPTDGKVQVVRLRQGPPERATVSILPANPSTPWRHGDRCATLLSRRETMRTQVTLEIADTDDITVWSDNVMVMAPATEANNWDPGSSGLIKGKPDALRRLAAALIELADNMDGK